MKLAKNPMVIAQPKIKKREPCRNTAEVLGVCIKVSRHIVVLARSPDNIWCVPIYFWWGEMNKPSTDVCIVSDVAPSLNCSSSFFFALLPPSSHTPPLMTPAPNSSYTLFRRGPPHFTHTHTHTKSETGRPEETTTKRSQEEEEKGGNNCHSSFWYTERKDVYGAGYIDG